MTSISPVPDWTRSFSCTICPERKKHIAPRWGAATTYFNLLQICHPAGVDDFSHLRQVGYRFELGLKAAFAFLGNLVTLTDTILPTMAL